MIRTMIRITKWQKSEATVGGEFDKSVQKHPDKKAVIMGEEYLTFRDANKISNQVASVFREKGFKKGDCVALLMETKLEYPFIWVGLSKIGVECALINFNLRNDPLIHSIKIVNSKAIIVSAELREAVDQIRNHEDIKNLLVYQYNSKNEGEIASGSIDLRAQMENVSIQTDFSDVKLTTKDKLVYIYTSGTTGLPKAAVITHSRYFLMPTVVRNCNGVLNDDIIYDPIPLYHTAGGIIGIGIMLIYGNTLVMRKKFSASNYFVDCIKYNCTVAQYVGELFRFVLAVPPREEVDRKHKVRLMFGNGVKPEIWNQFVERFGVVGIGEFYGSTEGNCSLINNCFAPGSCGFMPNLINKGDSTALIRCDDEGEPIRDNNGLCIRCEAGEPGIIIGRVREEVTGNYNGYSDKAASNKKLLRNVFKQGDVFFNSGDILVHDIFNTFYFVDRIGDTFRWRGENVSTTEVEDQVSKVAGLKDCTAYGVQVPHTEGKAGMCAIMDRDNQLNIEELSTGIKNALPPYARPLFIRVMADVPMTSTFKVVKKDLLKDGFNIHAIKDPVYFLHSDSVYRRLTDDLYQKILKGEAKL